MPLAEPCTNTCETNSAVLVFIYTQIKGVSVSYLLCGAEKRKSIRALLRLWKTFTGVEPKNPWNCLKLHIQQKAGICFILNSEPEQQLQQHRHRVAPVPPWAEWKPLHKKTPHPYPLLQKLLKNYFLWKEWKHVSSIWSFPCSWLSIYSPILKTAQF